MRETLVDADTCHPTYRRRSVEDGGASFLKGDRIIDNSWVVPYNAFLLLRYQCHINIEICISTLAAKYLYKYVTKGPDRAMVRAELETDNPRNEIGDYEDMRSIGSSDVFYLRMLLHHDHCRGKTSFMELRTIARS